MSTSICFHLQGTASDFPDGSRIWRGTQNILDAVVFGNPGDLNNRLLNTLTPGQALIEVRLEDDCKYKLVLFVLFF